MQTIFQSAGADEVINENFEAIKPASTYGRRAPATAGLTWGYYGGIGFGNTVADGTLTLAASATNYIVASRTSGAVSSSTNTTNWNNTAAYCRLYQVVAGLASVSSYVDHREFMSGGGSGPPTASPQCFPVACSDETTALTTGAAKVTFRMPYAFTLTAVRASLTTAQTSGSIFTVDVNVAGASILSTKLTIDNTEKSSVTAATPAVISNTSLANDAEVTIDIDQIGNGTAKGLKVYLIGAPT